MTDTSGLNVTDFHFAYSGEGFRVHVPQHRTELAQLGLKAMVVVPLACYCTACVAGLLL